MNLEINKIIKKILLEIEKKQMVGQGLEHQIFPSRNNPDRVYKVGYKETIKEWLPSFLKFPELFPKIYKVRKIKKSSDLYYIELERLNTESLIKDWEEMDREIFKILPGAKEGYNDFTDLYLLGDGLKSFKMKKVYNNLSPKSKKFFKKLSDLLEKIEPLDIPDAHMNNFGYDKNGNIKCLDL